ncbi:MAG: DUF3443 domain-containing protein [Nitrospirae bacterium]|nr:DUF3443 domain-containing protein [Nitrospirota bacterium]MBF0592800.1 DUF3443 domain-containing protein [Nitrospirota bacterium]
MRSNNIRFLFLMLVLVAGCGGSGGGSSSNPAPTPNVVNNVLPLTINGSLCSTINSVGYYNKPCVSVTVCTAGTSTCQTINDILLDTGSSGLRIFKQVLSVSLVQATVGSGSLAECIQYVDGSSNWGPVQKAGVILGTEPAVQVPIQVIDPTFGGIPATCTNATQSPVDTGYNGILGVSPFVQDCGSGCANSAANSMYYSCNGASCIGVAVPLSSQVQNPVALLPQDNNGVIVQLPAVALGGVTSVNGSLILGIGTQSNNSPSQVTVYPTDQYGEFTTKFNGISYSSFIDTGSNGLFFASPSKTTLPNCPYPNDSWFCPLTTTSLTATNAGAFGSPSGTVSFQIGNFNSLASSSNNVFVEIGGNDSQEFDWGLPFNFGRNIYYGIEGTKSSLGTGPYFAY